MKTKMVNNASSYDLHVFNLPDLFNGGDHFCGGGTYDAGCSMPYSKMMGIMAGRMDLQL
jgi:hypothetical protein